MGHLGGNEAITRVFIEETGGSGSAVGDVKMEEKVGVLQGRGRESRHAGELLELKRQGNGVARGGQPSWHLVLCFLLLLFFNKQQIYFSQFWRLEVRDRVAAWSGSGEGSLLACRLPSSHCILTWL